jgi:hypothetical protein
MASVFGCGSDGTERVPVAGRVMVDGQPLSTGTIRFVPKTGRPASGAIQPDGSFVLTSDIVHTAPETGVPRGNYQVQVSSSKIIDDATIQWNVPQKYADFRTSGIEVTINEPTDHLAIELTAHEASDAALANSVTEVDSVSDPGGGRKP